MAASNVQDQPMTSAEATAAVTSVWDEPLKEATADRDMGKFEAAIGKLKKIVNTPAAKIEAGATLLPSEERRAVEEADRKAQEAAIYALGAIYAQQKMSEEFKKLFIEIRPLFETLPKARTAKIVRSLLDIAAKENLDATLQEDICRECIEWCRKEERSFLRHRAETRLAHLQYKQAKYSNCLTLIAEMLLEVKKINDNLLLVEIHLLESKLYFAVKNIPKAKAALTASRTHANAIHCPPLLQAEIDLHSGVIHAEEQDHNTSYSYFYEAFEAFHAAHDSRAVQSLKYMLLAKIMNNQADEVQGISSGRNAINYIGREVEALIAVAKSQRERSLKMFEAALETYVSELKADAIIQLHIGNLHEKLLEQNILRILEPYERVEISHIGRLIELPEERVQSKLGEMILDGKLAGTLDQGTAGALILFDEPRVSDAYKDTIETMKNISQAVDALHRKASVTAA